MYSLASCHRDDSNEHQAFKWGPTFPTIPTFSYFCFDAPTFPYYFLENALLSLLFSPKMFELPKIVIFFPRSLVDVKIRST